MVKYILPKEYKYDEKDKKVKLNKWIVLFYYLMVGLSTGIILISITKWLS